MIEIDWRLVLAFLVVQGGIILAAAKSIFVTKLNVSKEGFIKNIKN